MANEIKRKWPNTIVWADGDGDYGGAGGVATNQILLTGLADAACMAGSKVDLGAVHDMDYALAVRLEFDVAPAINTTVEIYFAPSMSGTANIGNIMGLSGGVSKFTGGPSDVLSAGLKQCDLIGIFQCTKHIAPNPQLQFFRYSPPTRFGQILVYNRAGQALEGDDVEMYVALHALRPEVQ